MLKSPFVRALLRPNGENCARHEGKALRGKAFSEKKFSGKEENNADF